MYDFGADGFLYMTFRGEGDFFLGTIGLLDNAFTNKIEEIEFFLFFSSESQSAQKRPRKEIKGRRCVWRGIIDTPTKRISVMNKRR